MKRRKIKPPTDVSYGLFELAARACGFSQLRIMEQVLGPDAAVRSAKGLKTLTKKPETKKPKKSKTKKP